MDVDEERSVKYEFGNSVKESHKKAIYGAQFNPHDPTMRVFATLGANRVRRGDQILTFAIRIRAQSVHFFSLGDLVCAGHDIFLRG